MYAKVDLTFSFHRCDLLVEFANQVERLRVRFDHVRKFGHAGWR
jgi:hypothetical protein